jgi:pantoate--beta-alanine ligase
MIVATNRGELADARAKMTGTVAVVMTMGALHDGHEALIRAAAEQADEVLVTLFVNPFQFGPNEDFDRYPRALDADLAVCARNGVGVVFAPSVNDMYPHGQPSVRVDPGPLGEILEGASRPGFFHGVLTVVLKLLHLTRPDFAFFGEKDYQQLTLVRRMVRDTDLPVHIVGVPTVREPDGLALSSRNRYLDPAQRRTALALWAALAAGVRAGNGPDGAGVSDSGGPDAGRVRGGGGSEALPAGGVRAGSGPDAVLAAARAALGTGVELDYLALTDPELGPAPGSGTARLLIAARVGSTRLIDNTSLEIA